VLIQDDSLRAIQRHHDLKAFLRYEHALRAAYAKSKDPKLTGRSNPSLGRGVQGNSQFDAPC